MERLLRTKGLFSKYFSRFGTSITVMNTQQLSPAAHTINIHIKGGESNQEEGGWPGWDGYKRM